MELVKVVKDYLRTTEGDYPGNSDYWKNKFKNAYRLDTEYMDLTKKSRKVAEIQWEKRYSRTLDNDKFGRWMRIGRINNITVAIMQKVESDGLPVRFLVRLPNNRGDESLQNNIVDLYERAAMEEAQKYIRKYINDLLT